MGYESGLDAVEIVTQAAIKKANFDKTIQAQILSCVDATIGKYRCRYQDSVFCAYSATANTSYSNGSDVYILVPGGDFGRDKTILGSTKKLGINYISQAEGDEAYDLVGNNCVSATSVFYLDTGIREYSYKIYQAGAISAVNIDTALLERYIHQSSSLIVGAYIKTSIPPARQARGHYGIRYNLRFKDNATGKNVIRPYVVDEDCMVDNPYRLPQDTRQYQIFDIDGSNFIRVESIEIFCNEFPGSEGESHELLTDGDIRLSSLEICGAVRQSDDEINGISISFYTPQGTYFSDDVVEKDYKTIQAIVKVRGKKVDTESQKIPFYWGREDIRINAKSKLYNKQLGRGWRCENEYNVTKDATETDEAVIEWVDGTDTFILNREDATARENRIKVAIKYDETIITKEITITNLANSIPELTIESSDGTQFYHDIGHPDLTCFVRGVERNDYQYIWGYENNTGAFYDLDETSALNEEYDALIAERADLLADIDAGKKFQNAETAHLQELNEAIYQFNFIQRVEGNHVWDVQIAEITNFRTFKCAVYNELGVFLGTASIKLLNSLGKDNLYSLVINNGSEVFQYNENGVAPTSSSVENPQEIQALTFSIYNNLGQLIEEDVINNPANCQYKWCIPIKNTLLVDTMPKKPPAPTDGEYNYYENNPVFVYGIARNYDIRKQKNQIKLVVNFKGMTLTAETSFTFAKQGEPGTNGTEYLVRLIPNTTMNNPPQYPMVTKAGSRYFINYGIDSGNSEDEISPNTPKEFFIAQFWKNGEIVWDSKTGTREGFDVNPIVTWGVLTNEYGRLGNDESAFTVASDGKISYKGDFLAADITSPRANIIKCTLTLDKKTYYATIPIVCAWVLNENFRVDLKEYTGWRYAIYSADGVYPQYDNSTPFEFEIQQKLNGVWDYISLADSSTGLAIEYEVDEVGDVKSEIDTTHITQEHLIEIIRNVKAREKLQKNQWNAKPRDYYDGHCVNAAITCVYKQNNVIVGRINVPIHFLLNKYGLSYLNDWDGNSISIDESAGNGGVILAPQMGAGRKDDNNRFTGVLMGEVKYSDRKEQIGLFGFESGSRSFFLNSENGSAIFGKENKGQIIIDPKNDNAMLYSYSFWKSYNPDTGLPRSYSQGNRRGEGLLIDLTKPEIVYGSGNFVVNEEGHAHIAGGGDIAGWVISQTELYSDISEVDGRITLSAGTYDEEQGKVVGPGKIFSHSHKELTSTGNGFYLSHDGFSLGSKLKFTEEGKAYIGEGAVSGIGSYWTIDGNAARSYIAYGTAGDPVWIPANDPNGTAAKIYLGTDGLSLGTKFSVSPQGDLIAFSGEIGGWTISENSLESENIELHSDGSITTKNETWWITKEGEAHFTNVLELPENNTYIGDQNLQQYIEENSGAKFLWPNLIDDDPIADGASNKVLEWDFESDVGAEIAITATFAFNIILTVVNDTYSDAELTVTYKLDDVILESYTEIYGDGDHILTVSHILKIETAGIHALTMEIAMNGGSLN